MNYHPITIPYKNPIDALLYRADHSVGTIVYSHGLFSSKDAYKINQIAPALCQSGYTVLSFSYTYTRGYGIGMPLSISLADCADELNEVLMYAAVNCNPNLHIIGSSMGGAIALYYCAAIPYSMPLKTLTLIATPAHLQHIISTIAPHGINGDHISIGDYTIASSSLLDMEKIQLIQMIPRIDIPVCIIHGQNDDVVPVSHAYELQDNLCVPHRMHILSDGDHTLASQHHVELLRGCILSWLHLHP